MSKVLSALPQLSTDRGADLLRLPSALLVIVRYQCLILLVRAASGNLSSSLHKTTKSQIKCMTASRISPSKLSKSINKATAGLGSVQMVSYSRYSIWSDVLESR